MKRKNRIDVKTFLLVSVGVFMFTNVITYVLLISKNEEWKNVLAKNTGEISMMSESLGSHVYYDGDTIPADQTVKHYSRSGVLLESKKLGEVLQGERVVLLISSNSCSSCAKEEVASLLEVSEKIGSKHIIMISDFAMHKQRSWSVIFDQEGFYETDVEHMGLRGTPTHEEAVLMLVQDGRVKTSFPIGPQSRAFVDGFHDFLIDYFNEKG